MKNNDIILNLEENHPFQISFIFSFIDSLSNLKEKEKYEAIDYYIKKLLDVINYSIISNLLFHLNYLENNEVELITLNKLFKKSDNFNIKDYNVEDEIKNNLIKLTLLVDSLNHLKPSPIKLNEIIKIFL